MPKSLKRLCRGAGRRSRLGKVKVCLVLSAPPPALRTPGTAARPSAGHGLRGGQRASERSRAASAPGRDPAARMTARGAAGRCPPTTWLGPRLLLVCLLVSRSITEESKHCSHMIGDGHLQLLQQMIDSQMETSCKIPFQFVNEDQLKDHVCYIKKAFFLAQDIMEDTISFKDNTSNAIALVKLQELSVRLEDCFPQVYEEQQETACVQNFSESPLWALEKIKNVFNETKNLLKMNQSIFSKNCSDSFAKCSVPDIGGVLPPSTPQASEIVRPVLVPSTILVLLVVGGLLLYWWWRRRSHRELQTVDSPLEQPEGSPLTQHEDRQVEMPV
ncbi:macrophage colony-stimulating factor 1 isoform X3 [Myotis myotis]|uniref:macrophage colony-stimulating factor 1 isoform X3 n=1 Tax=Myotis myotis TaxID=51298 RepID=UPI00174B7556|nr:macrophage colony-stimulating factor 1 isoform X3 [Myotis myotis]